MRTLSRITIAGAAALALLLAPVGAATARTVTAAPGDHREDSTSITLTSAQRSAILTARSTFIATAASIRTTYRQAVTGALQTAAQSTEAARLAYDQAKDAYVFTRMTGGTDQEVADAKALLESKQAALRSALDAARAAAKPTLEAAKNKARTDLDAAKTVYVNAVNAAVPNAPAWLLVPPGGGKSWLSHGFGKDMGMGMHG